MGSEPAGLNDLDLLKVYGQGQSAEIRDQAFNEILLKHRQRLRRMVQLRMNPQLHGRLDASDVIQDAYVEANRTLETYLESPGISVFLWLRKLTGQKLIQAHRKHLNAEKRSARREQSIFCGVPAATSHAMAIELSGKLPTPSEVASVREQRDQLTEALEKMEELDREILMLRHFEQLSNREAAEVMEMEYETVKKRYVRALEKLRKILIS